MKFVKTGLGIVAAATMTAMLPVGVGGTSSAVAQSQAEVCPAEGSEITCVYFPSSGITWCYISKCGPG